MLCSVLRPCSSAAHGWRQEAWRQPGSEALRRPGSRAAGQPGGRAAGQPGSQAARQPGGCLGDDSVSAHNLPGPSLDSLWKRHETIKQTNIVGVVIKTTRCINQY